MKTKDTNTEIIEKKGVFIERAEPLTLEGIKSICMSDEDYDKYKAIQKALTLQKEEFEKMIEEFREEKQKECQRNGKIRFEFQEVSINQFFAIMEELLTRIKELGR